MPGFNDYCLFSRRVILPGSMGPRFVHVARGTVVAVRDTAPPGVAVRAFGDAWISAGFMDLHTHGRAGISVDNLDGPGLARLAAAHARQGVTAFVLSTMAGSVSSLAVTLARVDALAAAPETGFLGIHLEGPFLNPEWAGAQDPRACGPANLVDARRLREAGGACLRSITLAPERDPGLAVTRFFASEGVVVSLGHSAADPTLVRRAVEAGATTVTHLFNGMPRFHHRRPGLVGAALTEPDLACELIADGVHVDVVALCLAVQAKGWSRCLLVSDSISPAGLPDGTYSLGSTPIRVEGGVARTAEGRLAGSTASLDQAVHRVARAAGVSVDTAARMASQVPAEVLGDPERGRIEAGRRADLVVFDETGVRLTLVGGETVWVARDLA
jgi:N-acetylglucosamine-6-phosphate deacetylase